MRDQQLRNQHLMWRAGFGPSAEQRGEMATSGSDRLFYNLLKASESKPEFFDVADPALRRLVMGENLTDTGVVLRMSADEKKFLRKQSVLDIAKLNVRWLDEMTHGQDPLREKMSLFWHGHFAAKTINIFYDQQLLDIIRKNALGNFRDLLLQVSQSASMIQFLNNNQNRKDHPNENFARELMELFTLGRGNYSELDVKESARAFTGWGTDVQGHFIFRARQHDGGAKTFLGKNGNFSGEDIISMLLERQETASFITRKIYRYFVNEQLDEEKVNQLSVRFYQSGYDIRALLISIFKSNWFYDSENIGSQIKSPVVWLVGMRRQLPMEFKYPASQIMLERLLGQVLFSPPNVAGWPGGRHWIDSSSLMLRMQVPKILYRSEFIPAKPKDDDDVMMGIRDQNILNFSIRKSTGDLQFFKTDILWNQYIGKLNKVSETALFDCLAKMLLQKEPSFLENDLNPFVNKNSPEDIIQSTTIRIMSTPEYQLC